MNIGAPWEIVAIAARIRRMTKDFIVLGWIFVKSYLS